MDVMMKAGKTEWKVKFTEPYRLRKVTNDYITPYRTEVMCSICKKASSYYVFDRNGICAGAICSEECYNMWTLQVI
jgi:hypothetical protein